MNRFLLEILLYQAMTKEEREREENFGESLVSQVRKMDPVDAAAVLLNQIRGAVWDLLEYPETSRPAQLLSFISISMVFISTGGASTLHLNI